MKIIVYTITECQFSKQEKEYLTGHNLPFDEKNLETNREFLTEMLTVSNNFAGTPVTKIEKEDGSIVVLKGFTKADFDKALGFEEKKEEPAKTPEAKPAEAAAVQTPAQPAAPAPEAVPAPVTPAVSPAAAEPAPAPTVPAPETPAAPAAPAQPDPMADILNNLAQQATAPDTAAPAVPPAAPANGMPQIPDPQL